MKQWLKTGNTRDCRGTVKVCGLIVVQANFDYLDPLRLD